MIEEGGQDVSDLLPVRMLNEYAYCPRLFHFMYVQGRWEDNAFTQEGRKVHRRVDKLDHVLPDATTDNDAGVTGSDGAADDAQDLDGSDESSDDSASREKSPDPGDDPPEISRSVPLDSAALGLSAKLDLVATADNEAVPVETKRGRVPDNEQRCWEPERVQLMAQGLLLREQGYQSDHGVLYFAGSRTRVDVPFSADLESRTRQLIDEARRASQSTQLPPPLEDSPKCPGCSLAGVCLPDETRSLTETEPSSSPTDIRRLYPARDDALPLYVQEQGAQVGKTGNSLVVRKQKEQLARASLNNVSQLVLCGNISITAQSLHLLCQEGIPIVHMTTGHWFCGITTGIMLKNAFARSAQFQAAEDSTRCLTFAKAVVAAKGANQRTMLRRNTLLQSDDGLNDMADLLQKVEHAESIEQLLGLEGNLAAKYFGDFRLLLNGRDIDSEWDFKNRNRRPPRDPINAMLSFGYALLAKECTVALMAEGLDPWWGLFHKPRHGRPALALDLMEEFRPLVVDSAVITAVNTGMVARRNFRCSQAGCIMTDTARKAFIRAYEARLDHLVTHPIFDYRCSWRSIIRIQARLLARWLTGDVPNYTGMVTR